MKPSETMREIEASWKEAFIVWWAYCWRTLVLALPAGWIMGILLGIALAQAEIPFEGNEIYAQVLGALIGTSISIWVLKYLLSKNFGSFRVAVLRVDRAER